MSYDWLRQVMSDCVALRETEGNHIITFAFWRSQRKTHNGVSLITINEKAEKRENNSAINRFALSSAILSAQSIQARGA